MLQIPEEIKDLYKKYRTRKNLRIHFPNGERADITNDNLISESFSFTESICSQQELKFGLCEASVVEFECIGIENIKGYEIEVFHEIDISSLSEEFIAEYGTVTDDVSFPYYRLPYGVFMVDECPKNAKNMAIRSVTAYGITTEGMTELTPLEAAKRRVSCGSNIPYKIDAEKYLYSNLRGDFKIEGAIYHDLSFTTAGGGIAYATHFASNQIHYYFTNEGKEQDLYYLNYKKKYTLKSLRETVLNWVAENLPKRTDDYARIFDLMITDCRIYPCFQFDGKANTEYAPIINQHYFCPYLSSDLEFYNKDTEYYTRRLHIPLDFEIRDSLTQETLVTFNLYDESDVTLQQVILPDDYDSDPIWLEIPRVKKKVNGVSAYFVEEDIHYPVEVAAGLLELKGLFGLYRRSNVPEFVSMKGKFGLYPSETLYPSPLLYPSEANAGSYGRTYFQSAWFDDYSMLPYGKITGSYINTDGEEIELAYQISKQKDFINTVLVQEKEVSTDVIFFEYLGQTVTISDAEEIMVMCPYPIASASVIFETEAGGSYGLEMELEGAVEAFVINEGTFDVSLEYIRSIEITLEKQSEYSGKAYLYKYDYEPVYYNDGEYATYDMSDNYILKNCQISEKNLLRRLDEFADNVRDIVFMPAEVELIGMPWIEAGDVVEIVARDYAFETVVMNRTLKGIQALKDSYESN